MSKRFGEGARVRRFRVRQLAAAFLRASLPVETSIGTPFPASNVVQAKAAASCRTLKLRTHS